MLSSEVRVFMSGVIPIVCLYCISKVTMSTDAVSY